MSEIAPSYVDVWQREHKLDPETRRALEAALGPRRPEKKLAIEKGACHQPELLAEGGRIWGFMVQLYGLRSERNWGIGDFSDLRTLVELAASLGAGVVGVNPLHAAHVSPYSPVSRHALNTVYLDIDSIPELGHCLEAQQLIKSRAFLSRLLQLRKAELVDYDGVRAAKNEVLELLYACFRKDRKRRRRFAQWHAGSPRELRDYASREIFEDILKDTEEHVDHLETQLELVAQVGEQNYLQSQMHGG